MNIVSHYFSPVSAQIKKTGTQPQALSLGPYRQSQHNVQQDKTKTTAPGVSSTELLLSPSQKKSRFGGTYTACQALGIVAYHYETTDLLSDDFSHPNMNQRV